MNMARLEDITRITPFTTPEGYFDTLPGRIQSRIAPERASRQPSQVVRYALRVGFPMILLAAGFFYYDSRSDDAETILASVRTEDMIDYLEATGMSTEEMLESVSLTAAELEALEDEVYDLGLEEDIKGFDIN